MNKQNSITWIRHIEKLYKNGKAGYGDHYQHDSEIIIREDTLDELNSLVSELIEKFGAPKRIIVSPFLRTRQTFSLIKNILLNNHQISVSVEYSTDIAEYLGFCKKQHERQKADLHPETKIHFPFNVYLGESLNHFKERVYKHFVNTQNCNENVWIITHGIVLSSIYTHLKGETPEKRPKPLNYVNLFENNIIKNF
jgi:broad specificity phosphatase PhoE